MNNTNITSAVVSRPETNRVAVERLLAGNPDLVHRDYLSKPEFDSSWWEEIQVPVVTRELTTHNMISIDWDGTGGWRISSWTDERYQGTDTTEFARAFAVALTRSADICDTLNGVTK